MTGMRKKYTTAFKAQMVREILKEDIRPLAAVCTVG
jgi:transposase-like protein